MLVLRRNRPSELDLEKREFAEGVQFSELRRIIRSPDELPSVTSDTTSLCVCRDVQQRVACHEQICSSVKLEISFTASRGAVLRLLCIPHEQLDTRYSEDWRVELSNLLEMISR
jgi:hypothetical protein